MSGSKSKLDTLEKTFKLKYISEEISQNIVFKCTKMYICTLLYTYWVYFVHM